MDQCNRNIILRILVLYLLFGVAWIIGTDVATTWMISGIEELFQINLAKGILFVIVSALVIGYLLRRELARREAIEADLQSAQDLLKRAFDNFSDALFVIRAEDRVIIDCNPAAEELFGYSREELIGSSSRILHVDRDHFEQFAREGEDLLREQGVFRTEFQLRRKNGETFPTEHLVISTTGKSEAKIFSIVWDLTQQKEAEERVRESRQELSAILQTIHEAVVLIDLSGEIQFANRTTQEVLGWREKELIGLSREDPRWNYRYRDGRSMEETAFVRVLQTGEPVSDLEIDFKRKDGTWITLSVNGAPIKDSDGKITGVVLSTRDISERAEMERELEKSRTHFQNLIANISDVISVLAEDGTIVEESPSVTRILGYEPRERVGQSAFEYVHPEDRERARVSLLSAFDSPGKVQHEILRARKKDGSWAVLEAAGVSPREGADFDGLVVTSRDVTRRKEAEEALRESDQRLRQAQKMEAVGRLAGGIAHDFNNLLTVILGHARIARDDLQTDDPLDNDLEQIESAAERGSDLTRRLLAFGRKQILQPKIVNLNRIVSEAEKLLRRIIGEDIELVSRPSTRLKNVRIDPAQMNQIILNLAINARDAMPRGGQLTISTQNTRRDSGDAVRLSIKDTGTGMDAETADRMFEPFFTTKESHGGTGLGLSVVYGIVKQSNGDVEVETEPSKGTTIHIFLPAVDEDTEDQLGDQTPELRQGDETVLLIEDESAVREIVRRMLEKMGHQVLTAAVPSEARKLFSANEREIDFIISDVVLPDTDGPSLTRELTEGGRKVPVLFISGYAHDAIDRFTNLEEAMEILEKPFTAEQLAERIRELLD